MRFNIQVLLLSFLFHGTFGQGANNTSGLDSILKAIGSMNATLMDRDRRMSDRMRVIEDEVSKIKGTMARFAKLEPIQTALAEEEKRRKMEQGVTDRLLLSPRAKLYSGLNYTGDLESYDFKAPTRKGGCYNLAKLSGKIKSVDTEDTCVRIFGDDNCASWSQALYPGSSAAIDPKVRGVVSIGPCVRNEFEYATLTMSGNPPVLTVNKRVEEVAVFANVPDLVPDFWASPSKLHSLNSTEPITHYMLGQGGRLEAVYARIYPRHILSADVVERIAGRNQSFFPDLGMIAYTDEPGYVVPLELGGPAKKTYNVFAQDREQATKYRALLVPMIKELLAKYPDWYVIFAVALQYRDSAGRRPAGIWYRTSIGDPAEHAYGYFRNLQLTLGLHG